MLLLLPWDLLIGRCSWKDHAFTHEELSMTDGLCRLSFDNDNSVAGTRHVLSSLTDSYPGARLILEIRQCLPSPP